MEATHYLLAQDRLEEGSKLVKWIQREVQTSDIDADTVMQVTVVGNEHSTCFLHIQCCDGQVMQTTCFVLAPYPQICQMSPLTGHNSHPCTTHIEYEAYLGWLDLHLFGGYHCGQLQFHSERIPNVGVVAALHQQVDCMRAWLDLSNPESNLSTAHEISRKYKGVMHGTWGKWFKELSQVLEEIEAGTGDWEVVNESFAQDSTPSLQVSWVSKEYIGVIEQLGFCCKSCCGCKSTFHLGGKRISRHFCELLQKNAAVSSLMT